MTIIFNEDTESSFTIILLDKKHGLLRMKCQTCLRNGSTNNMIKLKVRRLGIFYHFI